MKLSERLELVLSFVEPGESAADVGTDHGHVPVELVRRTIVKKAVAMDVRKGPLSRATENIHFFQCFTLLRGQMGQQFQKLLLFLRGKPVLRLRMILAVHKRYLLLSANPALLSVRHESDAYIYNRCSGQDR